MESLDELLRQAEAAHGHLCAGQVLGVRMSLLGLARLGITDPHGADRKRLVTYVEIDRCATDAIALVTGCRLGKRALKFETGARWRQLLSILPRAAPFESWPSKIRANSRNSFFRISKQRSAAASRLSRAAGSAALPRTMGKCRHRSG